MEKCLKRFYHILLCILVVLIIGIAVYIGIDYRKDYLREKEAYIAARPQAVQLSREEYRGILPIFYKEYKSPLRFNAEPTGYFQYGNKLYYTFTDAPDFLLRISKDSWNGSMREELLVSSDVQLPHPQVDTAKQIMIYQNGSFSESIPDYTPSPFFRVGAFPKTDYLTAVPLSEAERRQLQDIAFQACAGGDVVPIAEEEWAYGADGAPKIWNLHWQFQEKPYLWASKDTLIQKKNGDIYLCRNPYLSASMGWWAREIQPIPQPAQSTLQQIFSEIEC